jgi:hypothetical protein
MMKKLILIPLAVAAVNCGGTAESIDRLENAESPTTTPTVSNSDGIFTDEESQACREVVDLYMNSLQEIDARLNVGLTQSQYQRLVGNASVEKTVLDSMTIDCKGEVLRPLNEAFRIYSRIAGQWDDCIWDTWCDPDSEPYPWQWNVAHDSIEEADFALNYTPETT